MVKRICKYCGKEFEGTGNRRYCCNRCSAEAAKANRKQYLKEHPEILQRQLEYDRARRQKLKDAIQETKNDSVTIQDHVGKMQYKAMLLDRISKGDLSAKCRYELLTGGNTSPQYWDAFRQKELARCEQQGTTSNCIVNGIPIYSDLFTEMVVDRIKETGIVKIECSKR